jgi:hypothetical protein
MDTKKTLAERLLEVQSKLKAPKNQTNTFSPSKYKYRNCEDILEAVKPLLLENELTLVITDEITLIGDRYYIKANAILYGKECGNQIVITAYAREEESKKGMDGSQITGSASSYARKYALNGLFLIDDTKDADTQQPDKDAEKPQKSAQAVHKQPTRAEVIAECLKLSQPLGYNVQEMKEYLDNADDVAVGKQYIDLRKQYEMEIKK